jgi:uncharacterized coiled-coil DUF342 family protein
MVDETIAQKVDEIAEEGKDLAEKAKEGAEKAAEDGKTGFDQIGDEIGKVVETAKEVGKEIWEDIKEVFDGGKKEEETTAGDGNKTANVEDTAPQANATGNANGARRRAVGLY